MSRLLTTNTENLQRTLGIQENAGGNQPKQNSPSELLNRTPIDNTQFTIVGNYERGFAITFGRYKLTEFIYQNPDDAKKDLETNKWNIIVYLISTMIQANEDMMTQQSEERLRKIMNENPPVPES